jgi:hypothetical protein
MTQQKRPISRSSTPIEFTPLILDLEPEEIKEEPKKKRGGAKLFASIAGIVLIIGVIAYWGFKNDTVVSKTKKESQVKNTINLSTAEPGAAPVEKKRIFTHGAKTAKLMLEHVGGQDVIKVLIQDKPPDGITWVYEWSKNNEPIGKGESVRGFFKRGDNVAVKILPFDGENYGTAKLLTTEIKNTVPRVTEGQSATFNDKNLTYQIKATDPDGDTLTYSLVAAPPGVNIDQKSGVITWLNVPENQQKLDLKIKINDGHNGEIIYQSTVNFSQPVKDNLTAQK